jgi:hypothetical protein
MFSALHARFAVTQRAFICDSMGIEPFGIAIISCRVVSRLGVSAKEAVREPTRAKCPMIFDETLQILSPVDVGNVKDVFKL